LLPPLLLLLPLPLFLPPDVVDPEPPEPDPEPVAEEPPAWAIFWLTAAAAAVAADTAEL